MASSLLERYAARLGIELPTRADVEALHTLHRAHLLAIPFENIDTYLHRPVDISPAAVEAKLLDARRGGYCFEHNGLFQRVLTSLGFRVRAMSARVHYNRPGPGPRTHMILRVSIDGRDWLADVGFGAPGFSQPIGLMEGVMSVQGHERFRLVRHGELGLLLQRGVGADLAWHDSYSFTGEEALPIDFEMGNYCTATYPSSPFRSRLICGRLLSDGRVMLRERALHRERGVELTSRPLGSAQEAIAALRDPIGVVLDEALAAAIGARWG